MFAKGDIQMKLRTLALALCAISMASGAMARTKPVSKRDQEQAACYDDAKRLCGQFFPSEEKVTECMAPMKSKVSSACAAFYE